VGVGGRYCKRGGPTGMVGVERVNAKAYAVQECAGQVSVTSTCACDSTHCAQHLRRAAWRRYAARCLFDSTAWQVFAWYHADGAPPAYSLSLHRHFEGAISGRGGWGEWVAGWWKGWHRCSTDAPHTTRSVASVAQTSLRCACTAADQL
jgi:hypothetical protein